ncbi:hypothetical protein PVK06_026455 [Gossypium arboreum]|uniref:Uncharacterized protein n=1 Tax=Gossypium arboreum TaxID=29729 RepID=A0ABR0NXS7_GOSAR|nr:hypothetical protein PVK06_026455 [Gossypium arboreum]
MDIIKALQRLAYVKVSVEVFVDFELPHFINVELRDGSLVFIGVEVPWLPMRYLQFRSFSHFGKYYSKKNEDSNDAVDDDIDAEQDVVDDGNEIEYLEFSPRKPKLASLAVALLMRSLIATKQENLGKGK